MGNWAPGLAALCDVGPNTTESTLTEKTKYLQLISFFEVDVIQRKSADILIEKTTKEELLINKEDKASYDHLCSINRPVFT